MSSPRKKDKGKTKAEPKEIKFDLTEEQGEILGQAQRALEAQEKEFRAAMDRRNVALGMAIAGHDVPERAAFQSFSPNPPQLIFLVE